MPGAGRADVARKASGGGGHRGSAGSTGFRGASPRGAGGKPATGPGSFRASPKGRARGVSPGRACGGHGGPEAACQGPCRNPRQTHVPRSVRIAAGATRAEGPEEGQADKPAPWPARRRLSDAGQHPATSGPRALSATPVRERQRSRITRPLHTQRHCPRAALRTARLSRESACT